MIPFLLSLVALALVFTGAMLLPDDASLWLQQLAGMTIALNIYMCGWWLWQWLRRRG